MPTWAMWAVCAGLLALRGFLAAAEAALYGTSALKAKELEQLHPRRGPRLHKLKTDREATAASLRFGMVLCGFTAAAIAALVPPRVLNLTFLMVSDSAWLPWLM